MSEEQQQEQLNAFRQAAGKFASGVTVVTTAHENHLYGITATSFVSLSLSPLLVTVSINNNSPILDDIRESGIFAINVLEKQQQHVSAYFASRGRGKSVGSFGEVETHVESTGAPIVTGALSWFDCKVHTMLDGGDHLILVGEVQAAGGGTGEPLLYFSGGYRELDEPKTTEEERKIESLQKLTDSMSVQLHMYGITPQQLIDAQQAVEPDAARLAALNASDEEIAVLREMVDGSHEHKSDAERYNPLALGFHSYLGMISGNPAIAASVGALNRSRETVLGARTDEARAARSLEAHREILEAIESRDAQKAEQLMAAHLEAIARGITH